MSAALNPENVAFKALATVFANRAAYEQAQRLAKVGQIPLQRNGYITWLLGMRGGWTAMRDAPAVPPQTFREWWAQRTENRLNRLGAQFLVLGSRFWRDI